MMAEKTCVKVLVEENGEHGFDSYRVPGIVTASNGDLLLAYEGREAGGNRRTLFFRRYQIKDGQPQPAGERITMVSPKGEELLHNPLLIAAPEGRVYFFWCQDYQRLFLRESRDNGETFGEERELTSLMAGDAVGHCSGTWNLQKRRNPDTAAVAEPWRECAPPGLLCLPFQR